MASNKRNLAAGIVANNPGSAGTSLVLETGYGQGMPELPFFLTLTPPNQLSTIGNSEIVEVTARTDDTMTITREQKGTTAKDIAEGWVAVNGVYVEDLAGGGYVAQPEPPEDTGLLWYDTDDSGVGASSIDPIMDRIYPVGSQYTNFTNSSNPAELLEMPWSTWEAIQGNVVVGVDASQTEFDTPLKTGGAKTHTLNIDEIPPHGHKLPNGYSGGTVANPGLYLGTQWRNPGGTGVTGGPDSADRGGGQPHNNLQPYITAYVWRRTS